MPRLVTLTRVRVPFVRAAYRGNFGVDFSTESHVAASLELLGHEVIRVQENEVDWAATEKAADGCDMFLWTQTYSFAQQWSREDAYRTLALLRHRMPTVGFHLDKWHGLGREHQVHEEPFFHSLDYLFTADGDADDWYRGLGVPHHYLPPAVFGPECVRGNRREDWASDVAFIGSWQGYGHAEHWPARKAMLDHASGRYRERVQFWPRPGRGAVRSQDLNDLLASVKVVLGDSCMASTSRFYWSDRATECVGRGGVVVHPWIEGLAQQMPEGCGIFYYPPGDMDAMCALVDYWVAHDDEREEAIDKGMAHVLAGETYAHRMQTVIDTLAADGAWS